MQKQPEIVMRDVEKSEELLQLIEDGIADLEKACDYIVGCHVAVERAQRAGRSGSPFRVRIHLTVPPGHDVVAIRKPGEGDSHEPLSSVVRDAFDRAERRLKKLVQKQAHETKRHAAQEVSAVVARIFKDEGYGFLVTTDNREIYFHRNSVLHDAFEKIKAGTGVHFVEEPGNDGPQATTVRLIDKKA